MESQFRVLRPEVSPLAFAWPVSSLNHSLVPDRIEMTQAKPLAMLTVRVRP